MIEIITAKTCFYTYYVFYKQGLKSQLPYNNSLFLKLLRYFYKYICILFFLFIYNPQTFWDPAFMQLLTQGIIPIVC